MASLEHKRNSQAQDYRPSLYTYENGFYYDCTTCFISQCHMHQQCEKREKKGRVRYVWIVLLSVKHGGGQQQRCYVTAGFQMLNHNIVIYNVLYKSFEWNQHLFLYQSRFNCFWNNRLLKTNDESIFYSLNKSDMMHLKRFETIASYWLIFRENMVNFWLNYYQLLSFLKQEL